MKILIIGANGQVGSEINELFQLSEYEIIAFTRSQLDCTNLASVQMVLLRAQPDLIINAAAYTAVDKAEEETNLAYIININFVEKIAYYCKEMKIPLIHLSTDYVFDGTKLEAYSESDLPNPQGVYAKSKFYGEQAIRTVLKEHIILRVSWVFGKFGNNFVKTILNLASNREELKIVADQWGRPTCAADIARVIKEIVNKINHKSFNDWGIYHYASEGPTNWYEFANVFINMAKEKNLNLSLKNLIPITSEEFKTKVKRPKNSVLDTRKIEKRLGIKSENWSQYLLQVIATLDYKL